MSVQREKDLYHLKIDEEFQRLIPPISELEYKELEKSIVLNGCNDAICVWNRTIIDGHNRYEICTKHQIPFNIIYLGIKSRVEAIAWICANLLDRRIITDEMRRYLIGKRYGLEKIIGAHNATGFNYSGKDRNIQDSKKQFNSSIKQISERLGKVYHLNPATVHRYSVYTDAIDSISEYSLELYDKILSGEARFTQDSVFRIAKLSAAEIRNIGEDVDNVDALKNSYTKTRGIMPKNMPNEEQLAAMNIGAIKYIPAYDPDSEIMSLALTVPSWIGSISRVCINAKFIDITQRARQKLMIELIKLKAEIDIMLSAIREEI